MNTSLASTAAAEESSYVQQVLFWFGFWEGWQSRVLRVESSTNHVFVESIPAEDDNGEAEATASNVKDGVHSRNKDTDTGSKTTSAYVLTLPLSSSTIEAVDDNKLSLKTHAGVTYYFQLASHSERQELLVNLSTAKIMSKCKRDAESLEKGIPPSLDDGADTRIGTGNVAPTSLTEGSSQQSSPDTTIVHEDTDATIDPISVAKEHILEGASSLQRHLRMAEAAIASFQLPDDMQAEVRELHYTFTCLLGACESIGNAVIELEEALGDGTVEGVRMHESPKFDGKNHEHQHRDDDTAIVRTLETATHVGTESVLVPVEVVEGDAEQPREQRVDARLHAAERHDGGMVAISDSALAGEMERNAVGITVHSFFTTDEVSFFAFHDASSPVTTAHFITATRNMLPFIDALGATFSTVKSDFITYLGYVESVFNEDQSNRRDLNALLNYEIERGIHRKSTSAHEAVHWLCRSLEFVQHLLAALSEGETQLYQAAVTAYERSLKNHHNWLLQKVFYVALRALPTYESLLPHLLLEAPHEQMLFEMKHYSLGIKNARLSVDGIKA